MKKTWAIIGGGNGGQSLAGHLAILGESVRLFDVVPATVEALNKKGCIDLHHAVNGSGKIEFATDSMEKVLQGADIAVVVLPSIYHKNIAQQMVPYLRDGMVVFLHPEASCGAIAFRKVMTDMGCTAKIVLGVACTLLYSTRLNAPGDAYIFGVKNEVAMAALPACDNALLAEAIRPVLPQFQLVDNVLLTSLANTNAMMHPAPTLLNTSREEADPFVPYAYYHEGITPSIGRYVELMDRERIAVAAAFGFPLRSIRADYVSMYDCGDSDTPLYQLCKNNKSYDGIMASNTLRSRYVLEDIPYSLVAISALAQIAKVATPCIDAIITLGTNMLAGEIDTGRTAEALGIAGMEKDELLRFVLG